MLLQAAQWLLQKKSYLCQRQLTSSDTEKMKQKNFNWPLYQLFYVRWDRR